MFFLINKFILEGTCQGTVNEIRFLGGGTIFISKNSFTQPCTHCGKTRWNVIGCNRIDNSKPHTMDNVEPCCKECNRKEYYNEHKVKVGMFDLNDNLIKEFNSIKDCVEETNIGRTTVTDCCNNKYLREGNNIYKQYKFKKLVC